MAGPSDSLLRELEAPVALRRFGSGWYAGFFGLVLALSGLGMVLVLRYPDWLGSPELESLRESPAFRPVVHAFILGAYALAIVSLLLRRRKALGFTALAFALGAALLGGSNATAREVESWGIFFGLDFFVLNMVLTGLMFAPLERVAPHREEQRLFRVEWREDLFYFLVSSMLVQAITFLTFAPSTFILDQTSGFALARAAVAGQPLALQVIEVMVLSDLAQYWIHRAFHRFPFLWGFHAVHHSAKSMDWLAGSRMHFIEIGLLRGLTAVPMITLGFSPVALQIYVGIVYVYSSLLHANVRGNFDRLGTIIATPRFHHWHHGLEAEAVDKNFAIHFPLLDRLFGTYHLPPGRWPEAYGVPEAVPSGYLAQFLYPFRRRRA
ncbi:sterol desaturase family protein [Sphingosinicella terrae]|uniref:sterol desaturase family protein n=1 Tax=Sphingosinicella terrae TaxID=2172047 RepID=UPI000E0DD9A2|nr:sterol desaturase family protein [Sphingosinicella terrae]